MLFNREQLQRITTNISERLAEDPGKWRGYSRKLASNTECSSPFDSIQKDLPKTGLAAHALNWMQNPIDNQKDQDEDGSKTENETAKGPCCQVCLMMPNFGCGDDGVEFVCEGQTRFICGSFTCNHGEAGHSCLSSEFICSLSFKCTTFDDTDGDCYPFDCMQPHPFERCPMFPNPFHW